MCLDQQMHCSYGNKDKKKNAKINELENIKHENQERIVMLNFLLVKYRFPMQVRVIDYTKMCN